MRRPPPSAVAVLATLLLPAALAAQDSTAARPDTARKWHFSVAGGLSTPRLEPFGRVTRMSNGDFLRGATQHGGYGSVGAARRIASTALELRAELHYNRLNSSARSFLTSPRPALRDESVGFATSLVWRARPQGRFTPYLVTGIDHQYVRLGTNPTPGDSRITEYHGEYNLGITYGAGVQFPLFGHTGFAELRRFDTMAGQTRGSNFMPLVIGWRF